MQDLNLALLQTELAWEAPRDNRAQIESALASVPDNTDLVLLPEMFTTGFSMNALANAEDPGGETELWLQAQAKKLDAAITGSIAVQGPGGAYNRMLFATPDAMHHYDKRHLFRMAGEHKRYLAGNERVVVPWRGWRILLQVCYDLRFPVFSRNRGDYDLAVYVANWPASRRIHWRQLLVARAIENQACIAGVNRIGEDAKGLQYSGDSMAVEADGTVLTDPLETAGWASATLSGETLQQYREAFPAWMDADSFEVQP